MASTVRVTDLLTSAKHYKMPESNFHGFDLEEKSGYSWVVRVNRHTPEELEEGRRINPFIQIVPIEEFSAAMGTELKPEHEGMYAIAWLSKGSGLSMMSLRFKFLSVRAFTEGVAGNYVEVQMDDE